MMRTIKIYVPPGQPGPLLEFLPTLDEKLRRKLLQQIVRLSQIHLCDLKAVSYTHLNHMLARGGPPACSGEICTIPGSLAGENGN